MKKNIEKNEEKEMSLKEFVNTDWYYGGTLLHLAVSNNNLALVRQAIKNGAELDKTDDKGETALFCCEKLSIAEELMKSGINPNILNEEGETAVASMYQSKFDILKYLIEYTDVDLSKNRGLTLLEKMISKDYEYRNVVGNKRYKLIELISKVRSNS